MGFRSSSEGLLQGWVEGWPFDLTAGQSIKFLPAVNDQGYFQIGNGSVDMDLKVFLGGSSNHVLFDVGNQALTLTGVTLSCDSAITLSGGVTGGLDLTGDLEVTGDVAIAGASTLTGFNRLPSGRYELLWNAGDRGKPGIPADAVSATPAVLAVSDPLFEITGTNGTSALCTRDTTGGIKLTTDTTANDQMILGPHTQANLSPWKSTAWLTNTEVEWECMLTAGADITNTTIWAGLKLTSDPTVATDDDQIFLRYQTTVNGGAWQVVSSRGGTDTTTNTAIVFEAGDDVHLKIAIQSDRTALVYIDGALVNTAAALVTNKSLIPFIGIQTMDAAAAAMTVRGQAISKAI